MDERILWDGKRSARVVVLRRQRARNGDRGSTPVVWAQLNDVFERKHLNVDAFCPGKAVEVTDLCERARVAQSGEVRRDVVRSTLVEQRGVHGVMVASQPLHRRVAELEVVALLAVELVRNGAKRARAFADDLLER